MAHDIWFISDTHFWHANILKFTGSDGGLIRPGFDGVIHMNEVMIEKWNSVVKPQDKVYHLGDVTFRYDGSFNAIMSRLHGHKRLMLGNHDKLANGALSRWFEKIELWTGGKFKQYGFVCSHIPLRPDQMRDGELNVHGHIHQNVINDPRYLNVCVERVNYTPVHLDEIRKVTRK